MPSNYEPKTIISPLRYDTHLLELHRQLALIAEDQDPPNPFNTAVEIDNDLSVALNDTNDLHLIYLHAQFDPHAIKCHIIL